MPKHKEVDACYLGKQSENVYCLTIRQDEKVSNIFFTEFTIKCLLADASYISELRSFMKERLKFIAFTGLHEE